MPRRCICVPSPRPSAVMPGRLISSGYFQRASYSRNPVGAIIGSRRNSHVFWVTVAAGLVMQSLAGWRQMWIGFALASRSKAINVSISAAIWSSGIMLGPSEGALSGSWWVSMNTAATPDRHGRAGHHRGEFALPAGRAALAARLLHRMGRVHHHRVAGLRHLRQRAHVGDQRVVAEGACRARSAGCAGCRCFRSWRSRWACPRAPGTGPS